MSETSRLSPMTSYYLRKFVEDRQDILHELLPELHGEITLDRLFSRMCRQSDDQAVQINIIESLVEIHKQVAKNTSPESAEIQNLDKRLLSSLGATETAPPPSSNLSISIAQDCIEKLNELQIQARFYLGETIGTKYLLEAQPSDPWCQQFKIAPKKGITYQGQLNERLQPQQIAYFETWIDNFSNRCGNIFMAFMESETENEALFNKTIFKEI